MTLLRETLAKKSKGSYTITFVPTKGTSSTCSLTVTDTAPVNEVSPSPVDFDANTSSGGYQDVTVTLKPADGATLKNIRAGGKTLEENWQYKVDGSTVTISKTAVAEFGKSGATYADFTFVMSKGQNPTLRVNYVTTYALTANVVDDLCRFRARPSPSHRTTAKAAPPPRPLSPIRTARRPFTSSAAVTPSPRPTSASPPPSPRPRVFLPPARSR